MTRSFEFDSADRFTAGAIGEPGQRIFFIQAESGTERFTLLAEKQQVAVLAQALMQLVDNIEEGPEGVEPRPETLELDEPLEPEWRAGEMAIQYDEDADRVSVVITEATADDEEDEQDPDVVPESARIIITRAQARAMAGHALEVVAAGRPRCQFCGNPMELEGEHICPAMNGHRKGPTD